MCNLMNTRRGILTAIAGGMLLSANAWCGSISSESYATAYSQGLGVIFPPSVFSSLGANAISGTQTAFYFTGTTAFVDSTSSWTEACAPATPVGNGIKGGCPTTRPPGAVYTDGANGVSNTTNVNNSGDIESYSGATTGGPGGLNESASFNASVTSPSSGQFGFVNDYATGSEDLIVAPTLSDPSGTMGTLTLTYTIRPPNVSGSVSGGNGYWYGEWVYQTWLSSGTTSTDDYQFGTTDLSTLTGPTQIQITEPFIFGSATNVDIGYDIGVGWVSTGGALTASASFDPMAGLTGVQIFGPGDAPITSFTIADSNGTQFGADGVVPEPSTWILLGTGIVLLAGVRRLQAKKRTTVGL